MNFEDIFGPIMSHQCWQCQGENIETITFVCDCHKCTYACDNKAFYDELLTKLYHAYLENIKGTKHDPPNQEIYWKHDHWIG